MEVEWVDGTAICLDGEMDVSMEVLIDDRDWMESSVFILPQQHWPVHQLKKHTRAFIMSPAREIMSMMNAKSNIQT